MADVDEAASRKAFLDPLLSSYIGSHRSSLPTPSLCFSLPTIKRNCDIFQSSLEGLNILFRAHVKTHKVRRDESRVETIEAARKYELTC